EYFWAGATAARHGPRTALGSCLDVSSASWSSQNGESSGCDEHVAGAADGHEALRLRGIALDLPAQVRDVHLAGVLVADVVARPEVLHELAAGDDRFRLLGEEREHLELRERQVDALAVDEHLVAAEVDVESAERADSRATGRTVELAAAQDRAHAAEQLGARERLRHVVVGAQLEPKLAVGLRVPRRQHEDRDVALGPQLPADLHAR